MEKQTETLELTILMPCLNEETNIADSIRSAQNFLENNHVKGEILIVDNHSTDQSSAIAESLNVRVVMESQKGYGNAVRCGIQNARGQYIILGDCDSTYNFENIAVFLEQLRNGYALVIGNRFAGGIEKGAMPFSHQFLGNPLLSWFGRMRYQVSLHDFHCGLRGFHTQQAQTLELNSKGMEFATELIAKFASTNLPITEVPTTLSVSKHPRHSHLHTFRDGMRHLLYMVKKS